MRYSSLRPNSPVSARTHKYARMHKHTHTRTNTLGACAPLLNYLQWLLYLNSVHHIHVLMFQYCLSSSYLEAKMEHFLRVGVKLTPNPKSNPNPY